MTETIEGVRNSDLETMIQKLTAQQAVKVDLVVPAEKLRSRNGQFVVTGQDPYLSNEGVTDVNGNYRIADRALSQVAERVKIDPKDKRDNGIPVRYLRKLHQSRPDVFDATVNSLFAGRTVRRADGNQEIVYPADSRSFLLRTFKGYDESEGLVRAFLSDRFGIVDHLDVAAACLEGIRAAGAEVEFHSCNLNDSNMSVSVYSPQVSALAPKFLEGYRNPFANPELEKARQEIQSWRNVAAREGMDYLAGKEPVVFAGFQFGNSETGNGKSYLRPKLMIKVCRNGLTLPAFEVSRIHIGAQLEQGAVQWSRDTQAKALDLIKGQARDAVEQWLSPEFLAERVNELEVMAGAEILEPEKAIEVVGKELAFTDAEREGIFKHFLSGRQFTAAGVTNAITSFSQTVADFERADALDAMAVSAGMLLAGK